MDLSPIGTILTLFPFPKIRTVLERISISPKLRLQSSETRRAQPYNNSIITLYNLAFF